MRNTITLAQTNNSSTASHFGFSTKRASRLVFSLCGLLSLNIITTAPAYSSPEISGVQRASIIDSNGDGQANPGEEVEYVITVTNPSAVDLDNLTLASTIDPNVVLSSAAKVVSSGAFDDCYGTSLNSSITRTAGEGLLSNDLAGFTIVPTTTSSSRGVSVSINSDGSFTYTPPANFSGTDTFSYSAVGSDGEANVGKVTITVLSALAGTPVSELQSILGVSGTSTIVSTLQADLNEIGAALTGAASTATTAALKSAVTTLQNSVDGNTTGSLSSKILAASNLVIAAGSRTNLVADISAALGNLGASGTLGSRISTIAAKLLVTPSGNLSADIGTLQGLLVATPAASAQADIRSVNTTLDGAATGGTTQSRISTLLGSIDNLAANLQAAVSGVATSLGSSGDLADRVANLIALVKSGGSSLNGALSDVAAALGGTGTLAQRVSSVANSILTTPTTSLSTDLTTARGLLVTTPGSTVQADIQTLASMINGAASGGTLEGRIGSAAINSVASNISDVLGNPGASIAAQLGDPGADYTSISDYLEDEGSTESIVSQLGGILSKLIGVTNSGQSLNFIIGDPQRPVVMGHPDFPLQDTHLSVLLGTGYPIATGVGVPPSYLAPSISAMLGGTGTTIVSRIQAILNRILVTPTETVRNDLSTLAALISDIPTATLEEDIRDINNRINGGSGTTSIQSRIGTPVLNGSISSLSSIIGGNQSTITEQLGDPVTGDTGLSSLIKAGSASCSHLNCNDFNNSSDLNAQLAAFISTMNNGGTLPPGSYNSLAEILAAMTNGA